MMIAPRILVAAILIGMLAVSACTSPDPLTGTKRVNAESQRDLRVAGGSREIRVEVTERDTVLRFGDAVLVCRDYRGYVGDFAPDRGWARVGKLDITWDGDRLRVRSQRGWAVVPLDSDTNLFAEQDGEMGRSIYRPS